MFKIPYGQKPIFAQWSRRLFSFVSAHLPIGSWSYPPSLTFISPNLFGENITYFFHLKTQPSHFFTSKLRRWSRWLFSTPSSSSSQLRPCLWDQPVSLSERHPHETASNKSEPKILRFSKRCCNFPAFLFAAALAALFGRAFALDSADSHRFLRGLIEPFRSGHIHLHHLHVEVREKLGCKSL